MSTVSTAAETITFEIRTHPDEKVREYNRVDAMRLRDMYEDMRMSCDQEEVQSLAEVFAGEEVREGFWVTDDPKFLSNWNDFAIEHGMLLVE
jgi:hypothetical protein